MPQPLQSFRSFVVPHLAWACAAAALACAALPARAVTLYDAGLGSTPAAQGWLPLVQGTAAAESVAGGRYRLDTTGNGVSIFGNARLSPLALDTAAGFDLGFTLQVAGESHDSPNRAGYSVLAVGSDATRSLEIAFWSDRVWVYDRVAADPDRMVHGAEAAFDTASASHDYRLAVRSGQYTLLADGGVLLAGALRDYTAEGAPYNLPNLLFFGDDTSRGSSVTLLQSVTVTPVPEPAPAALLLAGGAWLAWRRRGALSPRR